MVTTTIERSHVMKFPWISRRPARQSGSSQRRKRSYRPQVDVLEDRLVLATFTWTGNGANNLWSTAANWSGPGNQPGVPGTGDDLAFTFTNVDPTSLNNTNDLNNPFFNSLHISSVGTQNYTLGGTGIQLGAGGIDLGGSLSTATPTINLPISFSSSGLPLNADFGTLTLAGALSGSGTVTTTGRVVLAGNNPNFTGQLIVNGGTLVVRNSGALGAGGTAANGTVVNRGTLVGSVVLDGDGLTIASEVLTLNEFGTDLENPAGSNTWAGNIVLAGANDTRDLRPLAGQLTISGVISSTATESGPPSLEIQGNGTAVYAGSSSNTHAGLTHVSSSTLILQKAGGAQAIAGPLQVSSGTVRWNAGEQIDNAVPVQVDRSTLDLNGFTETIGPLTLDTATLTTGTGTLVLNGNVTQASSTGPAGTSTISGNLSLGSATRTFTVNGGFGAGDLVIAAAVHGGTGVALTKAGAGTLVLSGPNDYVGPTNVNQGAVAVASDSALGGGSPNAFGTIVAAGAALELRGSSGSPLNVAAEDLGLTGTGIGNGGALRNVSGNNTWGGNITVSGNTIAIGVDTGSELLDTGPSGSGNVAGQVVRKVGGGRLVFANSSGYNSETEVAAGTLTLRGASNAGAGIRELRVLSGATVELEDRTAPVTQTNIRLAGNGVNGAGALRVADGTAAVTSPISLEAATRIGVEGPDSVLTLNGMISGAAANSLTKVGTGNLVLSVANDYDGATFVNEGVLTIKDGAALGPNAGSTTVKAGATLDVDGAFDVGGETLALQGNSSTGVPAVLLKEGFRILMPANNWTGSVNLSGPTSVRVNVRAALALTGAVSGTIGSTLSKEGPGTLALAGAVSNDTLASEVTVNQGLLTFAKTGGAQALSGDLVIDGGEARYLGDNQLPDDTLITVNSQGVLGMNGHTDTIDELDINGGNVRTGTGGNLKLADKIVSNNADGTPSLIDATGGSVVFLSATSPLLTVIDGPADVDQAVTGTLGTPTTAVPIIKDGAGRLEFRTPFNQPGQGLRVTAGVVRYVNAGSPPLSLGNTDVADGATLELSGGLTLPFNFTALIIGNGVNGAGALHSLDGTNTVGGIKFKGNARVTVDAGQLNGGGVGPAGGVTAATNLIKDGAGTLAVTNYTASTGGGTLTVNAGTMLVNGSAGSNPVPVTVNPGATFGGSGLVGAITLDGTGPTQPATLAPGNAGPGVLTANGNVVFDADSTFTVELNPGGSDQLSLPVAASTVSPNGATLNVVLGFRPANGTQFTIVDNAGTDAIPTKFAQGSSITVPPPPGDTGPAIVFGINYAGGSNGNDIVLRVGGNAPAFANPTLTPSTTEGGTVVLSGQILEQDANDTFFLDVNWGDGSVETFTFPPGSPRDVSVTHRYADNVPGGVANVFVSWRDAAGPGSSVTLTTTIANLPPVIPPVGNTVSKSGVFTGTIPVSDAGGDPLQATINFGDGSPVEHASVVGNSLTLNHRFRRKGNLRVTVTVTDKDGGTATTTFTVRVKKVAARSAGRKTRRSAGLG
jgi:autotransporter-associated beta strand protein